MQNNKATPSVANTGATMLSGACRHQLDQRQFRRVGDTITVNGTVITFVAAGAVGNQLNVTDNIATLLAQDRLDHRHRDPVRDLRRRDHAAFRHRGRSLGHQLATPTAFAALGFTGTATATRGGGGTVGTGQVVGNDNSTFLDESVAGGAVTTYDVSGAPVNLQFRWAKTDSASLGAGHTDTWNLFYQVNPNATGTQVGLAERQHQLHFLGLRPDVAGDRLGHAHQRRRQRRVARQPRRSISAPAA